MCRIFAFLFIWTIRRPPLKCTTLLRLAVALAILQFTCHILQCMFVHMNMVHVCMYVCLMVIAKDRFAVCCCCY